MPVSLKLDNSKTPTRHAEIGAINALTYKSRQSRLLKKTTLVVIRFIEPPPKQKYDHNYTKATKRYLRKRNEYHHDNDGNHKQEDKDEDNKESDDDDDELSLQLACSRPCSECIKVIRALRIKSVIYVNDDNELVNESPDNIECTVHSGGTLGIIERRIT